MAWVVIEVSSLVFPALLIPDWAHRFVVVLAIAAFPIVIVIAWIYDVTPRGVSRTDAAKDKAAASRPPSADEALASIAVVPFSVISGADTDSYMAQSISAEIANSLARLPEVRVAPTHHLRDADWNALNAGQELDVQYLLTGSLRSKGQDVRVIAELHDVAQQRVIWSEAYERSESDAGHLEEEIAGAIVGSFGGEHLRAQWQSAGSGQTESLRARDLVHRARAYLLNYSRSSLAQAEDFAVKAIEIDTDYGAAYAVLASVLSEKVIGGVSTDSDADLHTATEHIHLALQRNAEDPFVLKLAGNVYASTGDLVNGKSALRRATQLTPFDFGAWGYLAFVLALSGKSAELAEAHSILDRIIAMAPRHPGQAYWHHHKALAFTAEDRFEEAARFAKEATDRQPGLAWAWYLYANALAMEGDLEAAGEAVQQAERANPELTVAEYAGNVTRMSGNPDVAAARLKGLRRAGHETPGA